MKGIDNGVTGDEDLALGFLFLQVALAEGCGREIIRCNTSRNLAVHLLRPGAIDVVGAQASLYMANRNLLVEGCQGSSCAGGGISVNEHHIGLALLEDIAHTSEYTGRDIVEVLSLLHDVQVVIGLHIKDGEHLVQHLTVLTGNTHYSLKLCRVLLELLHQRAHFNSLWACSKH